VPRFVVAALNLTSKVNGKIKLARKFNHYQIYFEIFVIICTFFRVNLTFFTKRELNKKALSSA